MAIHSGFLPGKIPWTEEPSGLLSMGSQRVRHGYMTHQGTDSPTSDDLR